MFTNISQGESPQTGFSGTVSGLARVLFLAGLLAVPWMIGGVPYWAATITSGTFLLVSLLVGAASFFKQPESPVSRLSVLLGLLAFYPVLQLLPISNHPVERLEHVIDSELVDDAHLAVQSQNERYSVSCVPAKTRQTLAMYATAFAVFLFSGVLWNTPGRLRFLFLALTANGVILSLFGMIQKFRWNGAIYGVYQLEHGGQPFASFVNRNNASAYLLVCLAAGVGLMGSCFWGRNRQDYYRLTDRSGENRLLIGFSLILIAAGIVASLSRSGILSATLAAIVILAIAYRSGKAILVSVVFLAGLSALAVWFGWGSELFTRFAVLRDISLEEIARVQHWKSTWPAIKDFGLLGSGLGTYSMVNRPYQPHENYGWFVNADNQYVEWLLELGVIGFSLLVAAIACLFQLTGKLLSSPRTIAGFRYSLGITVLFLLTSQMVHAIFDFGITRPATHLSIAAVLGAISAFVVRESKEKSDERVESRTSSFQLKWNPVLAFGCLIIMTSVVAVTAAAYPDEKLARQVSRSIREIPKTTGDQLRELRGKLLTRAEKNPESLVIFESLAQIDQALMRLEFLKTQGVSDAKTIGRYWDSSSPARLTLTVLGRESLTKTLHRLWKKRALSTASETYKSSLMGNIRVNPLDGYAWRELGIVNSMQTSMQTGEQSAVLKQLECAALLRPSELDIQMICAIELAISGEEQKSKKLFQGLMVRCPQETGRIWEAARRCFPVESIVQKILPADVSIWVEIWELLSVQKEKRDDQLQFALSVSRRLEEHPEERESPPGIFLLAMVKDFMGEKETALELIKKAVQRKPLEGTWRKEYARMLVQVGQINAAREQLETAHQMSPHDRDIDAAYRKVLSLRSDKARE